MATKWSGFLLIAITVIISTTAGFLLPVESILVFTAEGGVIETLSASLWIALSVSAAAFVIQGKRLLSPFVILTFLAGAREFDAHIRFTSDDMSNLSYWFDPTMPVVEKLAVLAILLPITVYLIYALLRAWSGLSTSFVRGDSAAYTIFAFLLLAVFLRMIDHLPHLISYMTDGLAIPIRLAAFLRAVEEIGELALPILGFLALFQYLHPRGISKTKIPARNIG